MSYSFGKHIQVHTTGNNDNDDLDICSFALDMSNVRKELTEIYWKWHQKIENYAGIEDISVLRSKVESLKHHLKV